MTTSLPPHFSGFEMSSSVRNNVVWDSMTVNKLFYYKSIDVSFGRSTAFKKRQIHTQYKYLIPVMTKCCLLCD